MALDDKNTSARPLGKTKRMHGLVCDRWVSISLARLRFRAHTCHFLVRQGSAQVDLDRFALNLERAWKSGTQL